MYRPPTLGGLGIHNVLLKAQAGLIKTFMETAQSSTFRQSLYHSMLFRYHVLEDMSIPNPGFPPFYNREFFSKIQEVHLHTPLNVTKMSEKQWYRVLLEDCYAMEGETRDEMRYTPCRVELSSPTTDWERSWRMARLPGLGPENVSFLFKMLHQILPTQERVARTSPRHSPACPMPRCACVSEDLPHALVLCQANDGVGSRLMACLREYSPNIDVESALRLGFEVDEEQELPLVWLIGNVLQAVWKLRNEKFKVQLYSIRAEL